MKKKLFIISGLVFSIVPLFINVYSIFRLLAVLLGTILLVIGLVINKKAKAWRIVFFPIGLILLSFALDFGITHLLKTIPVYSNKIVSSDKVVVYNSLLYREYSCDKKITIDNFNKKSYPCGNNDLEEIDSSAFLTSVTDSIKKYDNKFVKIKGKISKVNGTYNLEMQAFTLDDQTLNGYVNFSDSATLEINFNEVKDLTGYKVYDNLTVIGRVSQVIKKGTNYVLVLSDSIIIDNDLYNDYSLNVNFKTSCEADKVEYAITNEETFYTTCIDNIYVKYNEDNVYELSYALTDKKVTLDSLINKSTNKEEKDGKALYTLDNFKMLVCSKDSVIIGNQDLNLDSPYCDSEINKDL